MNESFPLVAMYFERKMLKDIGYSFDIEHLDSFDVEVFRVIAQEINKIMDSEAKRAKNVRHKH